MLQVDLGTMHVRCSVRGIRYNAGAWPAASGMLVQPSTGRLVLACSSGALQFYDPIRCCMCPMPCALARRVAGVNSWSYQPQPASNAQHVCRDVQVDRLQLLNTSTAHVQPTAARDTARTAHPTNFVFSKDARVSLCEHCAGCPGTLPSQTNNACMHAGTGHRRGGSDDVCC